MSVLAMQHNHPDGTDHHLGIYGCPACAYERGVTEGAIAEHDRIRDRLAGMPYLAALLDGLLGDAP